MRISYMKNTHSLEHTKKVELRAIPKFMWVCQDKCVSFLYFYGGRIIRPPFPYKYQLKGSSSASSGSISDARLI